MPSMNSVRLSAAISAALLVSTAANAQPLQISSFAPARNSLANPATAPVEILFDRPVEPASFTASPFRMHAHGERSGPIAGALAFLDGGTRVRFTPNRPFVPGERVWITMSHDLAGVDGSHLRSAGYSWQFWVASRPASMTFTEVDVLQTAPKGLSSKPYGGQACDLNNDGAVDLCIVNEDTDDLRVFMNNPGAPGEFAPYLQPTFACGNTPSPSETADFNGDGAADMVVANTDGRSISVLLGLGDGTFAPRTDYVLGSAGLVQPGGVAVLDVDGDGDIDIAATSSQPNRVTVFINDGTGTFGSPTFFDGGGNGERAINAADMNNDGIMDLVVGMYSSRNIRVHLGNGDGTFTPAGNVANNFSYWMVVCSDVNGDGNLDVTAAGFVSGAAVLLGDGQGGISPGQSFPYSSSVATDTGDLDGDGDLDWVLSNYGPGEWYLLENVGGVLTQTRVIYATSNPTCAVLLDFDLDGALDIALVDETADEVKLLRNAPPGCTADFNHDGTVNSTDVSDFINAWFTDQSEGTLATDWDGNGVVNSTDVSAFINTWFEDTANGCS